MLAGLPWTSWLLILIATLPALGAAWVNFQKHRSAKR